MILIVRSDRSSSIWVNSNGENTSSKDQEVPASKEINFMIQ